MNSFPTMLTRCATVTALATLALGAAGCSAVDRAGGKAADPVTTLTMAQANHGVPTQLQAWADLVEKDSGGSVKIQFRNNWRRGETANETGTISDIRAGKVDLGWVGVRTFDLAGDTDFQALLAPMLVDSYDLQAKVFEEGIPEEMLVGVSDLGVSGVAVLPGPMRKVLGITKPFRAPHDFRGTVVGMQSSALSQQSLEALGATTKAEPSGASLDGLDAYEQQLASINGNGYAAEAKYVTGNLNLWPRPLAILGNAEAIAALSDSQRAALEQASVAAVMPALDASRAEDADAGQQLCQQGMQMVDASDAQLAALAKAEQPAYDEIAANSRSAGWLQRIRTLKSSLSVGPDTASCDDTSSAPDDAVSGNYSGELAGTWTTTLSTSDWEDAAMDGPAGKFTLTFADGQVTVTEPSGTIGYRAAYDAFRGLVVTSGNEDELRASYRVDVDQLVISDLTLNGSDEPSPYTVVWTTHPFSRQR
jgi:TRAP-type C4-dicarboxylate transport system substrate-binding protein